MTELVRQQSRRTYKFMQTIEKRVGDELIRQAKKEGLTLQDMVRVIVGEWFRRNNHGS